MRGVRRLLSAPSRKDKTMKKGYVIYLKALCSEHGFVMELDFDNQKYFESMKKYIGCELLECVRPISFSDTPYCMLVDESGALKDDKIVNHIASCIYGNYIFGDAFILRYGSDTSQDFEPLTLEDIEANLFELVQADSQ